MLQFSFEAFDRLTILVACLLQSSAELVKEIATLEVQILRLERHLLSLYRTSFQEHLPRIVEDHAEPMNEKSRGDNFNELSQKKKSELSKDYYDHQCRNSPTSSLAGPNDLVQVAISKSSSGKVNMSHIFTFINLLFVDDVPVYVSMCESLQSTTAGEAPLSAS